MRTPRIVAGATAAALALGLLTALPASAAPTEVPITTGTPSSTGDATLRWAPVTGATGYTVEISPDSRFATGVVSAKTFNTQWVVPTTSTSDRYYWRVAAHDNGTSDASRGPWSSTGTFTRSAPTVPQQVSPANGAVVAHPTPVSFAWNPVAGAVSYTLTYSSDDSFPTSAVTTTVTTTGTSHTPANLLARLSENMPVTWHWKVRANVVGDGSATAATQDSPVRTFSVTWPASTSRPVLKTPAMWRSYDHDNNFETPNVTDPGVSDLRFSWEPVAGASRYELTLGGDHTPGTMTADGIDGGVVTALLTGFPVTTTSTSFEPTTVLQDGNYFWQVTAIDANGKKGIPSVVREVQKTWGSQTGSTQPTVFSKVAPEALVGGATAELINLNDFELRWTPVARATLYEVEVKSIDLAGDAATVLSCRTASTSATIVAVATPGNGSGGDLKGSDTCLWHSTAAKRIRPGVTYAWRVRGIDYAGSATTSITASNPAGTQETDWSGKILANPGELTHRFQVVVPTDVTASGISVDRAAWEGAVATQAAGQPSPVFEWNAVANANAYRVEIAKDSTFNNVVAEFFTPSTRLRPTGVLKDNTTGQPYFWRVNAGTMAGDSWSLSKYLQTTPDFPVDGSPSWRKSSTAAQFGPDYAETDAGGTQVLTWLPQFVSAPDDGGSRGYQVTITASNSQVVGVAKVEYPYFTVRHPVTGKPLPDGKNYSIKVAPLDANGDAGRESAPMRFDVSRVAPSGLAARATTVGSTLSWLPGGPTVRYTGTYWNVRTPEAVTAFATTPARFQSAVDLTDLAPGTYGWSVAAIDDAGMASGAVDGPTFTIPEVTPAATTPDGARLASTDRVLRWNAVAGASRYLVRIADAEGSLAAARPVETVATSYAPEGQLKAGATYFWSVTAVGSKSTTSLGTSSPRSFTVAMPPATPATPSLKVDGRSITATWRALTTPTELGDGTLPTYLLRYRLVQPDGAAGAWVTTNGTRDALSVRIDDLVLNSRYEFQVAATNSQGMSAWSSTAAASTIALPGLVTDLTVVPKLAELQVTWKAPVSSTANRPTSYRLTYRTGAGAWRTATTSSTRASLTGLAGGARYEVRVNALNAAGEGPLAMASATTLALPSAARSVKVTRGDKKAKVTWAAPASTGGNPITGYTVEMRTLSGKKWSSWASKTSTTGTRSASITGLANGTSYQVRVVAQTKLGKSPATTAVQFVPAGKPLAPKVKASSTKKRTVKVTWKAASSNGSKVTGYKVQYSTNGKTWKTIKSLSSKSRSYTWTKGKSKKSYYFRVQAKNAVGSGAYGKTTKVRVK